MPDIMHYYAENEFYQNGLIRINFFYSIEELAPLHSHDFYEMFLVTTGSAIHIVNNREIPIGANDLVFMRSTDIHRYSMIPGSSFRMVNLSFKRDIMERIALFFQPSNRIETFLNSDMPYSIRLNEYQKKQFIHQLLAFCYQQNTSYENMEISVSKLILDLFYAYYFRADGDTAGPLSAHIPDWFHDFYILMDSKEYFIKPLSEILDCTHHNPQYVMRLFKRFTGRSLTEHITGKRLDYAYTLLLHSDMPIMDIALDCGYENLSTFYHLFKRRFGYPPRSVRQKPKSEPSV